MPAYPKTPQITLKDAAKAYLQHEVLSLDNSTCLCCGEFTQAQPHHVKYRSEGGSDSTDNMCAVCKDCHTEIHHGSLKKLVQKMLFVRINERV